MRLHVAQMEDIIEDPSCDCDCEVISNYILNIMLFITCPIWSFNSEIDYLKSLTPKHWNV